MAHEFKIGGVSLTVDDPQGQLARAAPTQQRAEHDEAEALEASVRTVKNRPTAQVIQTVDPMGSIYARGELVDKMVNGKQGLASVALMWMLFGPPLITFAAKIALSLAGNATRLHGDVPTALTAMGVLAELFIIAGLGLMIRRTIRVLRQRRRANSAQTD